MPTNLYLAYTAPINPSGASPTLTRAQVWAGLQRKIRHAEEFVSAISTCDVLTDNGEAEVVREVVFAANPGKRVKEVVNSYRPLKVDFHQTDGSLVSNIVSDGPGLRDEDLLMTYTFQWIGQDAEPGSEEEAKMLEKNRGMAKGAVEGSIDTIRRLVKEGKI
ncbi:putative acetylaranotin biosynthesis cluster protein L [Elsinoe australis]|uniref:Putative acetylaranotin biosynthesis cluster protein L n=1 Tax=Elsinoe australis TaxID=40998 RepID=A0A4U7ALD5_9PEZI|nr:putative acetylaranotin biosynthesis cluster protein L [Elsinoe australis]